MEGEQECTVSKSASEKFRKLLNCFLKKNLVFFFFYRAIVHFLWMIRFIVMPTGSERGEKTLEEKNGGMLFFFLLITYQSISKGFLIRSLPQNTNQRNCPNFTDANKTVEPRFTIQPSGVPFF